MNTIQPDYFNTLNDCCLCPRQCHADRLNGSEGYCRSSNVFHISSICVHRGEEPVFGGENGICNIFFSRCNLQCIYCQNFQISTLGPGIQESVLSLDEVVGQITKQLDNGCTHVGFVSPSHMTFQVTAIINALRSLNRHPVFVYNTNAYDRVETLRHLEGLIDVYLPDFKYMDAAIAALYSGAGDYPAVAGAALKEMYRQKGSTLIKDENGCALSGLIVRHLVLPGHIENSKAVLQFIADELSPLVHVSLMSQYYPVRDVKNHPVLGRHITVEEYQQVAGEMENLGIFRGWVQQPDSRDYYRPDFNLSHPFE